MSDYCAIRGKEWFLKMVVGPTVKLFHNLVRNQQFIDSCSACTTPMYMVSFSILVYLLNDHSSPLVVPSRMQMILNKTKKLNVCGVLQMDF